MKIFTCYDCDCSFQAEAREELLNMLYEHYMKHHYSIITGASDEEKKQWMNRFEADWEQASEVI